MGSSPFICRTGSGPQRLPELRRDAPRCPAWCLALSGASSLLASAVFHPPPSPKGHQEKGQGSLPFPAGGGLPTALGAGHGGGCQQLLLQCQVFVPTAGVQGGPPPRGPFHASSSFPLRPRNLCNCIFIILFFFSPLHLVKCKARKAVCASALGSAPGPVRQPASVAGARHACAGV